MMKHHPKFGELNFDSDIGWWEGTVILESGSRFTLYVHTPSDSDHSITDRAVVAFEKMKISEAEARMFAADELLPIQQEEWSEGEVVDAPTFMRRLIAGRRWPILASGPSTGSWVGRGSIGGISTGLISRLRGVSCWELITGKMLAWFLVLIFTSVSSGCARTSEAVTDEEALAEEQFQIGTKYYYGEGVTKNYDEALTWFRFAAERGNSAAQACLGAMYANGQGVAKDQVAAINWFMLAARQGDINGQFNLGVLFSEGDVEIRNLESAYVWWFIGASSGDGIAQKRLRILEQKMTSEQVANARVQTRKELQELYDW